MANMLADKDHVRRNLRDALLHKKPLLQPIDNSTPVLPPIENPVATFINNFRKAGGFYISCNKENMLPKLSAIIESQKFSRVLNTNAAFRKTLDKHNIRYEEVIDLNYPADAVIVFSEILVARTGSIGFTQDVARYVSMKNLGKNLIVVSRDFCVKNEMEDALNYLHNQQYHSDLSMVEFLRPTQPKNSNGEDDFQPTQPRFILMMTDHEETTPSSASEQNVTSNMQTNESQN